MLSKFGLDFSFLTTEEYERKFELFTPNPTKSKEIDAYIKKLETVKRALNFEGVSWPSTLEIYAEDEFKREELYWIVYTRVPLHLACIQVHNLFPLKDGSNSYEEFTAFIDQNDGDLI